MEIIFVLLAISICIALFFLISFIWASKNGQFDDTTGPAMRVLFENDKVEDSTDKAKTTKKCK
ncbi:MAG: cbb3-type cytochrome oxidase assembly protein CcoS [Crocinitomicaceae bacterium]